MVPSLHRVVEGGGASDESDATLFDTALYFIFATNFDRTASFSE